MAFARKLAPRYDLLLVARRREALEALASELRAAHGADVAVLTADLADAAQLRTVADRLTAEPHLALLVNNAGFGNRGAFWEADLAVIEGMHRLHVMAIVRLTHAALTVLVAQDRGAVVNVASIAAFAHRAGNASDGATKSWLAALTEGIYLDLEHAGSAVRVQALCPGYTYSEFHDLLGEDRRRLAPASLWSTAEEVVDASLNALKKGTLVVVPGWRYRILVAVFTKFPRWLRLRLEASGA